MRDNNLYKDVMGEFDKAGNKRKSPTINININIDEENGYCTSIPDMYMDEEDDTNRIKQAKKVSKEKKSKKKESKFSIIDLINKMFKKIFDSIGAIATIIITVIVLYIVVVLCTYMFNNVNIVQDNLQLEQMFMR